MPGPVSAMASSSCRFVSACHDGDAVAGCGVHDGVADEVAQHLGQPVGVGVEHAIDGLHVEVAIAEERQVAAQVLEVVVEVDRPRLDEPSCLRAGQREHVGDQAIHLVQPPQQRRARLVTMRVVRLAVEDLDLGPQDGQRRAQLVRGVGDEVALASERPLQPCEHAGRRHRPGSRPRRALRWPRPGATRSPASTAAATSAMRRTGRAISEAIVSPARIARMTASDPTSANVRSRLSWASWTLRSGSAICRVPTRRPPSLIGA